MTALLQLYAIAGRLARPAVPFYLSRRLARGKEERDRLGERYGVSTLERPAGRLVWVHAASIGEMNAVGPLMERMAACGLKVLLTTGTVTSGRLAAERAGSGILHQYAPLDIGPYVDRFLDHWRPDAAILVESEVWPIIFRRLHDRKIPLAVVNGRMSKTSARNWSLVSGTMRELMSGIAACLAQTDEDAERFRRFGVRSIEVSGNLKFDRAPLPVDADELGRFRQALAGRPVWLAASSHEGEEELAWNVQRALCERLDNPLLIVVPRHPGRGAAIAESLSARGATVCRRSLGRLPGPDVSVYVADTLGELGLFYTLSPVAFIGGSLSARGGQNPIEAIQLGCAILHGPHVANFAGLYEALEASSGGSVIGGEEELRAGVERLLGDADARARQAEAAREVVRRAGGALEGTWAVLAPLLGVEGTRATGEAGS